MSDRKLKPLPPDPLRHQDSAIARSVGSRADVELFYGLAIGILASPHGSMARVDAPVPATIGASTRSWFVCLCRVILDAAIGMPRQSADGQSGRTNFQPVGGASTRSSRCAELFLAQPSASTFPTADGQGGRRLPSSWMPPARWLEPRNR